MAEKGFCNMSNIVKISDGKHLIMDDKQLVDKIANSKEGGEFNTLWNGDESKYGDESSADQALCNILAFWCNKDTARIDRLFRQSGLFYRRWDETTNGDESETYGQMVIRRAVEMISSTHNPNPYQLPKPSVKREGGEGEYDHMSNSFSQNLTDLGNAKRMCAEAKNTIRYCHVWRKWLIWDGTRWPVDDTGEIHRVARRTVNLILQEAANATDTYDSKLLAKHAMRSENDARLKALVNLAESEMGIPIRPKDLDANQWLFNCLNGVIDLRTGDLLPHDPNMLLSKLAPVEYKLNAQCPTWLRFINQIFNEKSDLIRFVQKALGYTLTGDTSEQCIFIAHGLGANGKSTLFGTIASLMGDYSMQTPMETLMAKKNDGGVPNDIARLKGTRFVMASEAAEGRRLNEPLLKQLTGQDVITARFMRGEWFEFEMLGKIWIATNFKPVVRGDDQALWRRLRLLPFEVVIPPAQRDKDLTNKLLKELPGILLWCIEGCLAWQKEGLIPPREVAIATEEYQSEMDTLSAFLDECCKLNSAFKIKSTDLYVRYQQWCEENGENPMKQRTLGLKMSDRGFKPVKSTGGSRMWQGLALADNRGNAETED